MTLAAVIAWTEQAHHDFAHSRNFNPASAADGREQLRTRITARLRHQVGTAVRKTVTRAARQGWTEEQVALLLLDEATDLRDYEYGRLVPLTKEELAIHAGAVAELRSLLAAK